jgi:hypothetical protein
MGRERKRAASRRKRRPDAEADGLSLEERRCALRTPTFKEGAALCADGRVIDCIVRNVSELGCLLKLDNAQLLPDLLDIRIEPDRRPRPAVLIWRSATLAGLLFVRSPS